MNYNNNNYYYRSNGDSRYQLYDDTYKDNNEINDNSFYSMYDEYVENMDEPNEYNLTIENQ